MHELAVFEVSGPNAPSAMIRKRCWRGSSIEGAGLGFRSAVFSGRPEHGGLDAARGAVDLPLQEGAHQDQRDGQPRHGGHPTAEAPPGPPAEATPRAPTTAPPRRAPP